MNFKNIYQGAVVDNRFFKHLQKVLVLPCWWHQMQLDAIFIGTLKRGLIGQIAL